MTTLKLTPELTCADYGPYFPLNVTLASLVCQKLSHNYIQFPLTSCNKFATKVSQNFVSSSATRIFADPEQSIEELVVNSADAYGVRESTGKFGMGFFSILYWLVGHPQRYLEIISQTTDCAYIAKIQEVDKILRLEINLYQHNYAVKNYLKISINAEADPLDEFSTNNFGMYLYNLTYITGVVINEQFLDNPSSILNYNYDLTKPINVYVSEKLFSVEDHATGISLYNLFNTLLIPGVSSKSANKILSTNHSITASSSTNIYEVDVVDTAVSGDDVAYLNILVGDIIIYRIFIDTKQPDVKQYNFNIFLPNWVPVPVSRDDLILDSPESQEIFRQNLTKLIKITILNQNKLLLHYLEEGLNKLILKSHNDNINNLILEGFQTIAEIIEQEGFIAVKRKFYPTYQALNSLVFIVSQYQNVNRIEDYLFTNYQNYFNSKFYLGYYVARIKLVDLKDPITNLGTNQFYFIDMDYITQHSTNYIVNLSIAYPLLKLVPYSTNLGAEKIEEYNQEVQQVVPQNSILFEPYLQVLLKIDGLKRIYNFSRQAGSSKNSDHSFNNSQIMIDLIQKLKLLIRNLEPKNAKIFLELFIIALNKLEAPEHVYGQTKGHHIQLANISNASVYEYNQDYVNYSLDLYKYLISNSKNNILLMPYNKILPYVNNLKFSRLLNIYEYIRFYLLRDYEKFDHKRQLTDDEVLFLNKRLNQLIPIPQKLNDLVNAVYIRTAEFDPYFERLIIELKLYRQNEMIVTKVVEVPIFKSTYTLRQLLKYIFNNNFETSSWTEKINEIKEVQPDYNIRLLETILNEGTSRNSYLAAMTELYQNSIDALAEFDREPENADINIKLYQDSVTNNYYLDFYDNVGIQLAGLLALQIPFYSTKEANSTVTTGEIGTGFFTIYKIAQEIKITTDGYADLNNDQNEYFQSTTMILRPLKNQSGRLIDVDVDLNVEISEADLNSHGTTISLNLGQLDNETVAQIYYIKNYIFPMTTKNFQYNFDTQSNQSLGISNVYYKILIYANSKFEFYYVPNATESYVTTKGIPFVAYNVFVEDLIYPLFIQATPKCVLNIKAGSYAAVTTRNKVFMSEETKEQLVDFLYHATYLYLLYDRPELLTHYRSKANLTQLTLRYNAHIDWSDNMLESSNKYYEINKHKNLRYFVANYNGLDNQYICDGRKNVVEPIAGLITNFISYINYNHYDYPAINNTITIDRELIEDIYDNSSYRQQLDRCVLDKPLNNSSNQELNKSLNNSSNQELNKPLNNSSNQELNKLPNNSLNQELDKSLKREPISLLKNGDYDKIIRNAMFKWFIDKYINIEEFKPQVENINAELELEKRVNSILNILNNFSQRFVDKFWEFGRSLAIDNLHFNNERPLVKWKLTIKDELLGHFVSKINTIELNYTRVGKIDSKTLAYLSQPITSDAWEYLNTESDFYIDWFAINYPASTLVHELEHAWRNDIDFKESGSHDDIMIDFNQLDVNLKTSSSSSLNNAKNYSFDEAANKMLELFILSGRYIGM